LAETEGIPWIVDETNPNAKHAANKKVKRTKIDPIMPRRRSDYLS